MTVASLPASPASDCGRQKSIICLPPFIRPHAGYYPDAMPMSIKITFDPKTGKLYGGQIVGYDGVNKRIDEIALVIKHEGTVYDLMKVEQAYAPPFSSAKRSGSRCRICSRKHHHRESTTRLLGQLRDIEMENNFLLDVRTTNSRSTHCRVQ